TGNMDPDSLKKAVEKLGVSDNRVKAVIPVHLAGHPCDMKAIRKAIEGKDVTVVEDAAHAFPSETSEGMAGTLGDIGVFSFYATKTITTGEGGMVATRNPVYEARMRLMRLHGIDRVVWNRYSKNAESRSWEYDVTAPGFKYNMSDLAAAIGRIQLKRADNLLRERRTLAVRYKEQLTDIPDLELPDDAPGHAWHLFIIRTRNRGLRDHLADELAGEGIGTSVHFIPLHRMTYWKSQYELNPLNFPIADDLAQRSLSLPLWPGLSRKNQRRTIEVIRRTLHG
ncbi:MAG: DegT/DnrJ/EryC1/StrS aminotransferase family protein, partial [Spirochaetaceae bacterium]|nr:DegT/DnrJ/EryC1/StrS aminotransferase family protein [Spirochaetaceae bacterium]